MATGLVVRLVAVAFAYQDRLGSARGGNWEFATELGMVAKSLATGHGFASPWLMNGETGPTACVLPLFPALLAGAFKLFGPFTATAAIAVLTFNSLLSVLTSVPVFLVARRLFDRKVAIWAAWLWALFPYGIYLSAGRIWDTQVITFLLAMLLWWSYSLAENGGLGEWATYGLLWGLGAMVNPSILLLFPVLALWAAYRRARSHLSWIRHLGVAALLVAVALTPWEFRNYRVFHRFVPLRDNFWLEVRVGYTGDLTNMDPDWVHPRTVGAFREFQQRGELAYMSDARQRAVEFIRRYPGMAAWITIKHVIWTWTGYWSFDPRYTRDEPFQVPNIMFSSAWTVLMLAGIHIAWRRVPWMELLPCIAAIVLYPALFYITHPTVEYRHVIDPYIVIFAACALSRWFGRRGRETLAASTSRVPARAT